MQLWQEQGEARLNSQDLYCVGADGMKLPLFRMNISQCGEWSHMPAESGCVVGGADWCEGRVRVEKGAVCQRV